MRSFLFIVCLGIFSSCASNKIHQVQKLTILHTNDHHGHFWANKDGEYGLAARATLIKEIREEVKKKGGSVLLLDAGDVNTGVPQSDLLDAEPDFKGMAALDYDVMAVGNHEFDNPLEVVLKQQREWAKFPFVSANIYDQNKKRVFPSHISKDLGDLKIIIFGLTTEDTPKKSLPENSKGLTFVPAVEEARKLVPQLRNKADVLIALTHMGHYPDAKHGPDAPGDVTLAREVDGIDLIIGGHTQKPLFSPDIQNGAIIVQAYEWGKYLGRIDLEIRGRDIELVNYELIPVNLKGSSKKIKPDPKILNLLKPFQDQGDKSLKIKIGRAETEYIGGRDVIRIKETNLGNLITTAFKEKFNADVGITNSGAIRDSIYPGDITIETIYMVLPFGGEVVTSEVTGLELKRYLETVFLNNIPGSGSYPQISGVEVSFNEAKKIKELMINGEKVDESRKYLIALPEFIAKGGDKFPPLDYRKYGYVDAEILKEYIQKKKVLGRKDFAP